MKTRIQQFFKVESHPHNLFWEVPPCGLPPPLKRKKTQPPSKRFLRTKKSPAHSLVGEDTMQYPILWNTSCRAFVEKPKKNEAG